MPKRAKNPQLTIAENKNKKEIRKFPRKNWDRSENKAALNAAENNAAVSAAEDMVELPSPPL
ncbi:MAG: hypothetical protein GY739_18585 [Mesoflavibacter sp.]|nr:hypothetical protein [Mesoflavibacter sp.]